MEVCLGNGVSFFFSSRRRHTRFSRDWSSDVCSSDLLAAIEHSWEAIHAHKEAMCAVTELIVRDGIEAGEFEPMNPRETAEIIMCSVVCFTHPVLVAQCLQDGRDLEADARASVRFLLRAITSR